MSGYYAPSSRRWCTEGKNKNKDARARWRDETKTAEAKMRSVRTASRAPHVGTSVTVQAANQLQAARE